MNHTIKKESQMCFVYFCVYMLNQETEYIWRLSQIDLWIYKYLCLLYTK